MTKANQKNSVRKNKNRKGATARNKKNESTHFLKKFSVVFAKQFWLKSMAVLSVFFVLTVSYLGLDKLASMPLSNVSIAGDLFYANQTNVKEVINTYSNKGFFWVSIKNVKKDLESLPWVHQAKVTRQWPDTLRVELKEESPIAFWGATQLINHQGDLFDPKEDKKPENLPRLSGPENQELVVMRHYEWLSHSFDDAGLKVISLSMDNKGAMQATLSNKVAIQLGSDDLVKKVQRFLKAYDTELSYRMDEIATVDLRYTNGLAVGWKTKKADKKHQQAGA